MFGEAEGQWQPCRAPLPSTPGREVGRGTRGEPTGAAATSLRDGTLEGRCFGVLAGDLHVVCEGAAGTAGRGGGTGGRQGPGVLLEEWVTLGDRREQEWDAVEQEVTHRGA